MEQRLGVVSIIVERPATSVDAVNELLTQFGDDIHGRLGLPYAQRGVNIITLVVDTSAERVSALTGELAKLPGVQAQSLVSSTAAPEDVTAPPTES